MATVTITFQDEDSLSRFDVTVYGTVVSRGAPTSIAAYPSGRGGGARSAGESGPAGSMRDTIDPRMRQTIVVLNTGTITLAEVQRALAAARRVRATAV